MMGALRAWLTSLVAVTLLLGVVQLLVPEGGLKKIAGFTGGLVLLAALLTPVKTLDLSALSVDADDWAAEIQERQSALESENEEALAALIAERTSAYISDEAAGLGLSVTARVETAADGAGNIVPVAAEMDIPLSETLASWMAEELNIPRERQVWHGEQHEN